jgi:hypothetical protein
MYRTSNGGNPEYPFSTPVLRLLHRVPAQATPRANASAAAAHACARSKPIVCAISTRASSFKALFSATVSTAFQSSVNAYHNGIRDHNRHGKANHADKRIKGGNHKFKRRHFEPVLSYI